MLDLRYQCLPDKEFSRNLGRRPRVDCPGIRSRTKARVWLVCVRRLLICYPVQPPRRAPSSKEHSRNTRIVINTDSLRASRSSPAELFSATGAVGITNGTGGTESEGPLGLRAELAPILVTF